MKRIALVSLCFIALMTSLVVARQQRVAGLGEPLSGISAADFEEFRLGLDDFLEVETSEEGLGPAFNGTSCAACHSMPVIGGGGAVAEVRAGRRLDSGEFEALDPAGETLFQIFSIPGHACQPSIPPEANVIARRIPVPVFGAGLIEAIADSTIQSLEDPTDRNRDGISGRAAVITDRGTGDTRVGRFGWKAQHATLLAFSADAYRNEMGITNDLFPDELALGIDAARMRLCDPISDPEDVRDPKTRRRGIDNFATFMRFLAPVARGASDVFVQSGELVFSNVGCAACHTPSMATGSSAHPLFDRKQVPLFSDLLLHDIGTGDGIRQAAAHPAEFRTPALWGLRFRRPLLHDGSAATIEEAILRHANEAAIARLGYQKLTDNERNALLLFLKSL